VRLRGGGMGSVANAAWGRGPINKIDADAGLRMELTGGLALLPIRDKKLQATP